MSKLKLVLDLNNSHHVDALSAFSMTLSGRMTGLDVSIKTHPSGSKPEDISVNGAEVVSSEPTTKRGKRPSAKTAETQSVDTDRAEDQVTETSDTTSTLESLEKDVQNESETNSKEPVMLPDGDELTLAVIRAAMDPYKVSHKAELTAELKKYATSVSLLKPEHFQPFYDFILSLKK